MSEIDAEQAPYPVQSQPMEEDAQGEEEIQAQGEQPQEEEQAQQEYYDDPYYQDDAYFYDLNRLQSTLSKDKPYCICKLEELSRKIWQDVQKQDQKFCMSQGWTLMLYAFTNFNQMYLSDLLDKEGTGKSIIKYDEEYRAPGRVHGECGVCLVEKELLINPCGDAFCGECWKTLVGLNWTDRNIYELFPLCPQEGCYHRTNYHLMEALWQHNPDLKGNFQRLLCLKYSQQSLQARLCPRQTCGKAFFINPQTIMDPILICQCGTEVCRHCGSEAHWPLQCLDLRSWTSLVSGREDQWINGLVVQKCPMCRQTIQKNNGCIHMTCRCKYQFCWICLKVWKGHGNYYACSDISRDDHEKKLKEEQEKKKLDESLYNQRLEETKGETDRLKLSIKRVNEMVMDGLVKRLAQAQVFAIHSELLNQMRDFIRRAWALAYRCSVFTFFEGERSTPLRRVVYRLNTAANTMDDYLSDSLKAKFKQMDDKITGRVSRKEGEEGQITSAERINLRLQFMKDREGFSFMIREGLKVIDQVKKGEVEAALQELINVKNPLYVDKEPLVIKGKKPSLPAVQQSQEGSE